MKTNHSKTAEALNAGRIGVIPTDTIYGIVARALDSKAVERVYEVRRRRPDKPCIILIADVADLSHFGIDLNSPTHELAKKPVDQLWPGPFSIIFPCDNEHFSYLHRGTKTLAFRLPADESLRELLRLTGPLIAPSANPEGLKPAATIGQARAYFDDQVDFYEPTTTAPKNNEEFALVGAPSTVVEIIHGEVKVLRQGSGVVPDELLAKS